MPLGGADDLPGRVVAAVLTAYSKPQLSSLLRFKGGMILENEVNTDAPFKRIVEDLVVLLEQNEDLPSFVALALGGRPNNSKLKAVAEELGVDTTAPEPASEASEPLTERGAGATATLADYVAAAQNTQPANPDLTSVAERIGADAAAPSPNLEALVAKRSRLIPFNRFQQRLDEIEARVCLVRAGKGLGTGFLVAPDLVLTNHHVVEGLIKGSYGFDQVVCEFDQDGPAAQPYRVGLSGPPRSSAPYSQSDLTGTGEPADGELDYALLPLAEAAGAGPRGFYPLDPLPRLLTLNDFVFVCQHPGGQALQLAMGTITDFPGKALRIRYDVSTEHGSSGSPCLSSELDVIGLHHAADPAQQPRYNQAVPLWLIARHAKAAGALP